MTQEWMETQSRPSQQNEHWHLHWGSTADISNMLLPVKWESLKYPWVTEIRNSAVELETISQQHTWLTPHTRSHYLACIVKLDCVCITIAQLFIPPHSCLINILEEMSELGLLAILSIHANHTVSVVNRMLLSGDGHCQLQQGEIMLTISDSVTGEWENREQQGPGLQTEIRVNCEINTLRRWCWLVGCRVTQVYWPSSESCFCLESYSQ